VQHLRLEPRFEPVVWHFDIKVWVLGSDDIGTIPFSTAHCLQKRACKHVQYITPMMEVSANFLIVFLDSITVAALDNNFEWKSTVTEKTALQMQETVRRQKCFILVSLEIDCIETCVK
jgi:hypothetical protein